MATMLLDLLVARRCENETPLVRSIDYNDFKHCVFVGSKLKKLELSNTLLFYRQFDLGVTSLFKNHHFFHWVSRFLLVDIVDWNTNLFTILGRRREEGGRRQLT